MAIPESQLDIWSKQGSVTQSKSTYATIKNALKAAGTPYADQSFECFLQGSYGNDTNVYAESDVDIVMKIDSIFYHDISRLPQAEQAAYGGSHSDASYALSDFKRDVTNALRMRFGVDVQSGGKAIWIKPSGGRRNADVLVAADFRRYYEFTSVTNQRYAEGICFFLADGTQVENFPKQHSRNCTAKHQATNHWFKPTVRIFKNMRNRMIEDGLIEDGLAPSYFLEGLLYNVPHEKFGNAYENTFVECFNWAFNADVSKLVCANGLHWLVRDGSRTSWPPVNYSEFLDAARQLWNQWS
jgi:hypothetical protein